MKYFNIQALNSSIRRIVDGDVTQEHRTGTVALGLSRNYFSVDKFAITPEQIQGFSNKRPDLAIEKFIPRLDIFRPHCYVEVKSLVNSNFYNIISQLSTTMVAEIDHIGNITGNFSVFMIAIKGTKIAIYTYHTFSTLLNDYGIQNYNGFIPLNYFIPLENLSDFNRNFPLSDAINEAYVRGITFNTNPNVLRNMGAETIPEFDHPHILDLLNEHHREDIHKMFKYVAEKNANRLFAD